MSSEPEDQKSSLFKASPPAWAALTASLLSVAYTAGGTNADVTHLKATVIRLEQTQAELQRDISILRRVLVARSRSEVAPPTAKTDDQ